jgi:hypothetical protein
MEVQKKTPLYCKVAEFWKTAADVKNSYLSCTAKYPYLFKLWPINAIETRPLSP